MMLEATLDATADEEAVVFDFRVRNTADSPVELNFSTGQTADIAVYDGDTADEDAEPRWRWSDGRLFTQALREVTLQPGEEVHEALVWNDAPVGEYVARGTLMADRDAEAETRVTVR